MVTDIGGIIMTLHTDALMTYSHKIRGKALEPAFRAYDKVSAIKQLNIVEVVLWQI